MRDEVALGNGGGTLDMTGLACSTISLTTGAIIIVHSTTDVNMKGPTDHTLTITGNDLDRVLVHNGEGTLKLDHLTITHGTYAPGYAAYGGGCIYALGSVTLQNSTVSNCTLNLPGGFYVKGGGIYAHGNLTLTDSVLSGNQSIIGATRFAYGGGAAVKGNLTCTRSTIRDNLAIGPANLSEGGGIEVFGTSQIYACTISGNQAGYYGGLLLVGAATITNSTISGNSAAVQRGGVLAEGTLTLDHATIAFNTQSAKTFGAGVQVDGGVLVMNSSIIAHNTSTQNAANYDLGRESLTTVSGSNNLITASGQSVPPDTKSSDPMLAPLADNGGATRTHALMSGSPAIDAGNNAHDLAFDQRGSGHPRVIGANADIGAFELNTDVIFADGFD